MRAPPTISAAQIAETSSLPLRKVKSDVTALEASVTKRLYLFAGIFASLSLLGWVTMALYGTFYALARDSSRKLAWTTFWLNNAGVIILFPSLAMVLKFGEQPQYIVPLVAGEFIVFGAMACFTVSVWQILLKSQALQIAGSAAMAATPAE